MRRVDVDRMRRYRQRTSDPCDSCYWMRLDLLRKPISRPTIDEWIRRSHADGHPGDRPPNM